MPNLAKILKLHQPHDFPENTRGQKISLSKFATFWESPNFNPHLGAGLMHGSHDHFQPTVGILHRQRFDACDQHFSPGSDAQMSYEKNPVDIPLYWLFNGTPYNGLLKSPPNRVV